MLMRDIEIEISDGLQSPITVENAGFAGEHNAACLVFIPDESFNTTGLKFYVEYQNRSGRTVRSHYLEEDIFGKIRFPIPSEISSQLLCECTFNIVEFDGYELVKKAKPIKIVLKFVPSPDAAAIYGEGSGVAFEELIELLGSIGKGIFRYEKAVNPSSWTFRDNIYRCTTPASEHKLGEKAALVLSEAADEEGYKGVTCAYYREADGDVVVLSHVPFEGRLVFSLSEDRIH